MDGVAESRTMMVRVKERLSPETEKAPNLPANEQQPNQSKIRSTLFSSSAAGNAFRQPGNHPLQVRKVKVEDDLYDRGYLMVDKHLLASASSSSLTTTYVEAEVMPGDTLQSLSIRYNVPVSELKRANNLFRESEVYALKAVRIPAKPDSLLTEILPPVSTANADGWIIRSSTAAATPTSDEATSTVASSTPALSESEELQGNRIDLNDDFSFDDGFDDEHELLLHGLGGAGSRPSASPDDVQRLALTGSKENRKAKRMFRNFDKDLARIREKQQQQQHPGGLSQDDPLDSLTGPEVFHAFSTEASRMSTKKAICTRGCIVCIAIVILAFSAICLLAYNGYHSKWFLSHSETRVHHMQEPTKAPSIDQDLFPTASMGDGAEEVNRTSSFYNGQL